MSKYNTEYQNHLLACIGEECGELQQAVGKALRFGLYDHHPDEFSSRNIDDIRMEFRDILAVFQMLMDETHENKLLEIDEIEFKKDKVLGYWNEC